MPTLYRYTKNSNSGTGYFVRAGVDGSVITLQTNRIAEKLYDELGYNAATDPEGGGDELPGRLVWSLYRVGLHHTEKQGVDTDRGELLDSLQQGEIQLRSDEIDKLRKFIEDNLERNEKLFEVAKHFDIDVEEGKKPSGKESNEKVKNLREIYLEILREAEGEVKQDEVSNLPEDVEDTLNGWTLSDTDEIKKSVSSSEALQHSVRQMRDHSWEVKGVQQSERELAGIFYHISPESVSANPPQTLGQRSKRIKIVVFDTDKSESIIAIHVPETEKVMTLSIKDGYIRGNPISDMDMEELSDAANHRVLAYLSFLHTISEEFIESSDEYELADLYSDR